MLMVILKRNTMDSHQCLFEIHFLYGAFSMSMNSSRRHYTDYTDVTSYCLCSIHGYDGMAATNKQTSEQKLEEKEPKNIDRFSICVNERATMPLVINRKTTR